VHFAGKEWRMGNLSIRGLDNAALAKLKILAAREDLSVNSVVVRIIEQGVGHKRSKQALHRHDDLDALAGTWTKKDQADFERATAPFSKVDAEMWK
jgi:plasmid stability protein